LSAQGAVASIWCLAASGIPAGIQHENANALVIARYGRRVGTPGSGFYWGALSFFFRQKSIRALRHPRSATGRRQRGLVLYGAASIVFCVLLLVSGAAVWLSELLPIATTAFHTSLLGAIGAVLLFAPITLGFAAQALHFVATKGAIPTRMGGEPT
jgi:hypothetical protein